MKRPLFLVCILLLVIVWLRLLSGGYERPPGDPFLSLREKERYTVIGRVCKRDENTFWIQSESICSENQGGSSSPEIILTIQEKFICDAEGYEVHVGDEVILTGELSLYRRATNPGEFDSFRYYRSLGVSGRLTHVNLEKIETGIWSFGEAAYQFRCLLKERLFERMPDAEAAVLSALLLGDKSELDPTQKDLYRRNGILHILSISSLHITILGMMLYRSLRKGGMSVLSAACISAGSLLFYGAMVGFSVSACRAIGMFLIRMLAEVCGRTYDCLTALGMLAAIMAIYRPFYLENVGFLLSFASVAGIEIVLPVLAGRTEEPLRLHLEVSIWRRWLELVRKKVSASLLASLSISLTTLPVQLWFYHEVPIWSVVINFLVLPWVKPLILVGLLCLLPFCSPLSYGPRWILSFYNLVCQWFDQRSLRTWNPGHGSFGQLALYYGLFTLGILWLKRVKGKETPIRQLPATYPVQMKKPHGMLFAGYLELALAVGVYFIPSGGDHQVNFLDVGQGSGVLLQLASGENYLYDCGSSSRSEVGRYLCLPALKYFGVKKLDAIFVSHPDEDHMNGILELLTLAEENHIRIVQIVLPDIQNEAKAEEFQELFSVLWELPEERRPVVTYLSAGEGWVTEQVTFTCLSPKRGMSPENTNAYSLALWGDFGDAGILLTGDLEETGEKSLLDNLPESALTKTIVLQVAHHGSRNATTEQFLQTVCPAASVISAGRNNRYGHPHQETLARLEEAGSQVFCTARQGAVTVDIGREVRVRCFLSKE